MENYIDWGTIIGYCLTPIASVASYFAGKKTRKNDFLQQLQSSIDMLVGKNNILLQELITVKGQNAELKVGMSKLSLENKGLKEGFAKLTEENGSLSRQVEYLTTQLENVKVITKIKQQPNAQV
jgi:predicted nuclease with TOPRIM domain